MHLSISQVNYLPITSGASVYICQRSSSPFSGSFGFDLLRTAAVAFQAARILLSLASPIDSDLSEIVGSLTGLHCSASPMSIRAIYVVLVTNETARFTMYIVAVGRLGSPLSKLPSRLFRCQESWRDKLFNADGGWVWRCHWPFFNRPAKTLVDKLAKHAPALPILSPQAVDWQI